MAVVTLRLNMTENERTARPLRSVSEYDLVVALHEMNTARATCWGFPDYPEVKGVFGSNWIKRELKFKDAERLIPGMMPSLVQIDVA